MSRLKTHTHKIDETTEIERLVKKIQLPKSVKNVRLEFGADSAGAPAVWIYLAIEDDVSPSKKKLTELSKFADTIKAQILDSSSSYWPYVRLIQSA